MTRVLDYIELETPAWLVTSPMGPDVVWSFTKPTEATPKDIEAIPSITNIAFTPATVSLGENLGTRASLTITFKDHPHIMDAESFDSGTFFGKWRGRFGQRLRGKPVRWVRRSLADDGSVATTETWHFVVEAVTGPTPDGAYTVTAQDILKLADDDRALAPRPTRGILLADRDTDDTSFLMGPTGIGDIDYASITNVVTGYVNIGGKEICQCTRVGDTLTVTRNTTIPGTTFETEVSEHKAGARVQLCLAYIGDDVADIISDQFETYAGIDGDFINLTAWQDETATFLQTLYTTIIPEPTGVNKLVTELVEQAGLAVWWDALALDLRLQVLRAVPTTAAVFNESKFLRGSLRTQDQPGKRISEVLVYYGMRNPLKPIDQDDNYRAALLTPDLTAAAEYNGIVTRTIKSRWIPFGGAQVAERLSNNLLGRYRDPPRKVQFDTWRFSADVPDLGQGYQLGWTENQDRDGNALLAPIQVTRLLPAPEKFSVEAEEVLFTFYDGGDLNNRTIIIPSNVNNVNLRDMHDSIYPEITDDDVSASPPVTLTVIINSGVIVGSTSTASPAFDVGTWPALFVPNMINHGRIQGRGGNGGEGLFFGGDGQDGGPALFLRNDINLDNTDGQIWGGGGGGGGTKDDGNSYGGGGGAGQIPGAGGVGENQNGAPGTTEAGGVGPGPAFDGGGPGQPGIGFFGSSDAGSAIDGVSFVNNVGGPGSVLGGQIN